MTVIITFYTCSILGGLPTRLNSGEMRLLFKPWIIRLPRYTRLSLYLNPLHTLTLNFIISTFCFAGVSIIWPVGDSVLLSSLHHWFHYPISRVYLAWSTTAFIETCGQANLENMLTQTGRLMPKLDCQVPAFIISQIGTFHLGDDTDQDIHKEVQDLFLGLGAFCLSYFKSGRFLGFV